LAEIVPAATSRDTERPGLYGVCLEVLGDQSAEQAVRFVSTDGHRLAWRNADLHGRLDTPKDRLLPTPLLDDLGRLDSEWIEVGLDEGLFAGATSTHRVVSKLREGSFPDYRLILPEYRERPSVTVDKAKLLEMVSRIAVVGGDGRRWMTVALRSELNEEGNGRLVGAVVQEGVGEARDEIGGVVEQSFEVGVLLSYLQDAMDQVDAKQIRIDYAGPESPLRFAGADSNDQSRGYFVMPRQLESHDQRAVGPISLDNSGQTDTRPL